MSLILINVRIWKFLVKDSFRNIYQSHDSEYQFQHDTSTFLTKEHGRRNFTRNAIFICFKRTELAQCNLIKSDFSSILFLRIAVMSGKDIFSLIFILWIMLRYSIERVMWKLYKKIMFSITYQSMSSKMDID